MDEVQVRSMVVAAVQSATESTRRAFQNSIVELTRRLNSLEMPTFVEVYESATIDPNKQCDIQRQVQH